MRRGIRALKWAKNKNLRYRKQNVINLKKKKMQQKLKEDFQEGYTCPPYGSKENWNQSIEELSCDEWIDICLNNYKCKSYLFVVDKTDKYKNYIAEEIINKSHFNKNTEKVILINRAQKG